MSDKQSKQQDFAPGGIVSMHPCLPIDDVYLTPDEIGRVACVLVKSMTDYTVDEIRPGEYVHTFTPKGQSCE